MRAFLPLALLAVTACYSPRSIEPRTGPYDAPAGAWDTAPLQASIWYDEHTGMANFDITRPANVAIFSLRPGVGVEMIYPAWGGGRRMSFSGGSHFVRTGGSLAMAGYSPRRLARNWSMAHGNSPIYILLIASEAPLDVGDFHIRGTMNWLSRSAITFNPYVTLEALAGEIVTNPSSGGWTSAMHVVWPDPVNPYRDGYMKVQCASGMVVVVPLDAWMAGYPVCPEQLRPDSAATDSTPHGWMTGTLDGVDLRKDLERVREENGKRVRGPLELTPRWPTSPALGGLTRTIARDAGDEGAADDRWVTRGRPDVGTTRASARPARPEARPSTRPSPQARPSRPEARPAPQARPKPQARPAPRPAPPPKPKPKPKPKPTDGGGGG